jgi:hypothetical protein
MAVIGTDSKTIKIRGLPFRCVHSVWLYMVASTMARHPHHHSSTSSFHSSKYSVSGQVHGCVACVYDLWVASMLLPLLSSPSLCLCARFLAHVAQLHLLVVGPRRWTSSTSLSLTQ